MLCLATHSESEWERWDFFPLLHHDVLEAEQLGVLEVEQLGVLEAEQLGVLEVEQLGGGQPESDVKGSGVWDARLCWSAVLPGKTELRE